MTTHARTADRSRFRPAAAERLTEGMRTDPVRIEVRTEWLYSEPDQSLVAQGRLRHAFARSGYVTRSDVPCTASHLQDITSHLHRAIAAFGDDKDLVIEVRLATKDPRSANPA